MYGPRILIASDDSPVIGCAAPSGIVKVGSEWRVVARGATVASFSGSGSKRAAIVANGGRNVVIV